MLHVALGNWTKFFVFVGILEKEDRDTLKRNHYSSEISQLTSRVSTTNTSTFTVEWSTLNILRLTDLINCEGMVVYSVRAVGRSVVRLPAPWVTALLLTIDKKLKSGSHCLSSPIVGTDDHNAGRGLKALRFSNIPFMEGTSIKLNTSFFGFATWNS